MLALDPPWAGRATLGGLVATNAFGPRRTRYGSIRDLIIGVSIVRADGTEARGGGKVVKNVAGFDLPKLMVGSLGTLGFIATITFRLHPRPETERTVLFADLDAEAVRPGGARPARGAARAGRGRGPGPRGWRRPGGPVRRAIRAGHPLRGIRGGRTAAGDEAPRAATRQGWGAESLDAEVAREFWARHDDARESSAGFRAKLAAQPMDLERVANGAIGSLFTALEVPRCVCYPTLGLAFVAGEVLVPGQVAASGERRARGGAGRERGAPRRPARGARRRGRLGSHPRRRSR